MAEYSTLSQQLFGHGNAGGSKDTNETVSDKLRVEKYLKNIIDHMGQSVLRSSGQGNIVPLLGDAFVGSFITTIAASKAVEYFCSSQRDAGEVAARAKLAVLLGRCSGIPYEQIRAAIEQVTDRLTDEVCKVLSEMSEKATSSDGLKGGPAAGA